MRALTWQGNEVVQVTNVADPQIQEPTDAIIRVTSTAICGSDLHLYGVLGPYLKPGDVLYIPSDEKHQFKNAGEKPFKFMCLIPAKFQKC